MIFRQSGELAFRLVLVVVGAVCFGAWQDSFLAGVSMLVVLYLLCGVAHALDQLQWRGLTKTLEQRLRKYISPLTRESIP